MTVPLSVLDLVPVSSGSTAGQAIRNTIDLARRAEALGCARYWVAEHHLNPGVAGTSPAVVLALLAGRTETIRLGSAAVLMGHRTPLAVVEEFGLLDAAHPGRFDLGLGRAGRPRVELPPPVAARLELQGRLLRQPGAETPDYAGQVDDVLDLLAGTDPEVTVVPGTGADLDVWVLGSSGGESAVVAGERGLPFAAAHHIVPKTSTEAVAGYRAAFRPSPTRPAPYVAVSADVVVADTTEQARELATGYAAWVRSIRTGEGAIAFPTPAEARALPWTEADEALVADRLATRLVGTAGEVADRLQELQETTGADELVVTTITHDHADRVRSLELLAAEWDQRSVSPSSTARANPSSTWTTSPT